MDGHACSNQMSNCNGCNGGSCKSNKIRPKFMPRRRRGLRWVFWTHYPPTFLNFFSTLTRLGCSLQLEGKVLVPKRRSLCSGPLSPFLMPSWKLLSTCNSVINLSSAFHFQHNHAGCRASRSHSPQSLIQVTCTSCENTPQLRA